VEGEEQATLNRRNKKMSSTSNSHPDNKPNQILYAFWDYDLCPYMLGGIVKGFTSKGNVIVRGYDGMSFKPIAILPDGAGKKALARLKEIRAEYDLNEKALKKTYRLKARLNVGLPGIEK
jgi:hypothetical protein